MKLLVPLVLSCFLYAVAPAYAQSKQISGKSWFGCLSRDTHGKMVSMAISGDREAFAKALARAILSGQCIQFKQGQSVHLTDTALLSGMVQIRPAGEPDSYWTNMEAIR